MNTKTPTPTPTLNQFKNGLAIVPPHSPLALYQHLANDGRLFFYDDHISVLSLVSSPDSARPGYFGITYNRDTRLITAHYFAFLGRGFLTSQPNPTGLSDHDLATLDFWRSHLGYAIPVMPPASRPVGFTDDHASEFEDWQNDNSAAILAEWFRQYP